MILHKAFQIKALACIALPDFAISPITGNVSFGKHCFITSYIVCQRLFLHIFCLLCYNMGLMGYYMTCLNAYLGYYVVFSMPALAYFYAILCYCSHEKTPVGGDNVVCVRVG